HGRVLGPRRTNCWRRDVGGLPALPLAMLEPPREVRAVDCELRADREIHVLTWPYDWREAIAVQLAHLPRRRPSTEQREQRLVLRREQEAGRDAHLRAGGMLAQRPDARHEHMVASDKRQ